MSKADEIESDSDLQDEYDFSAGVRGRYATRFPAGSAVVVLDPDVAAVFPTQEAVNEALRAPAAIPHGPALNAPR